MAVHNTRVEAINTRTKGGCQPLSRMALKKRNDMRILTRTETRNLTLALQANRILKVQAPRVMEYL